MLTLGGEVVYRPKTRETRAAYEALLAQLSSAYGDVPADVLRGACDEVLATLKADTMTDPERKRALDGLLGPTSPEKFAQLVAIAKLVTDWAAPGEAAAAAGGEALDDDIGVAVEFEEDGDDDGDGTTAVVLDEEEEDDGGEPQPGGGAAGEGEAPVAALGLGGAPPAAPGGAPPAAPGEERGRVRVALIDAYWLQREVSRACGFGEAEAEAGAAMAERVLRALDAPDDRTAEGALVALLDYDKFELVKLLLHNRARVLWCTRLARAQDEAQQRDVEAAMLQHPEAAEVLQALRAQRLTARERQNATESRIRDEARSLRAGDAQPHDDAPPPAPGGGGGAGAAAGRVLLELEALAFHQARRGGCWAHAAAAA